jgi:hypothetical protein
MPGKHHRSSFALISRHRYPIVVGVVLLCIAVAGVLAAVSNRRPSGSPQLIVPVVTTLPSPILIPPSVVPAPSPSPSPSRRPSSRPARPSPSALRPTFTAQYVAVDGRRSSFRVGVTIKNTGSAAGSWKVVVAYDPADGVRVFGSDVSTSGDTVTLSGGPLKPGKTVTVGYAAVHRSREAVRPTSCEIGGRACTVTTRRYRNESSGRTR